MKNFSKILLSLISVVIVCLNTANSEESTLLTGSVSLVPKSFYGTWRVISFLEDTNSSQTFKKNGLDLWNLSRSSDVIILSNPFNGAKAEIKIDKVEDNFVIFTKSGKYGNKLLTDTVEMKIEGEHFTGKDKIQLDTIVNNKKMKTETAIYIIKGEKIAGDVY